MKVKIINNEYLNTCLEGQVFFHSFFYIAHTKNEFIYDLQKSYNDLQNLYNSLKQALQKEYIINLVRKTNTNKTNHFRRGN